MTEYYLEIRWVHIAAVILSGSLFGIRGLARMAGAGWALSWPIRLLSYTIDTILLTAALMLMSVVQQDPITDGWLTMKMVLLIVYILLGVQALRHDNSRRRLVFFVAALLVFGFIVTVARANHPLGIFSALAGA